MKWFQKYANWKLIIPVLALYLVFPLGLFNYYQSQIDTISGVKTTVLDLRLHYTTNEVTELFNDFGKEGLEIYTFIERYIDMVYPIIYCFLLILILFSLIKRIVQSDSKWMYLGFIPIAATIFDYFENFGILKLIESHPNYPNSLVATTSLMTSLKWSSLFVTIGIVLILVLLLLKNQWHRKKSRSN